MHADPAADATIRKRPARPPAKPDRPPNPLDAIIGLALLIAIMLATPTLTSVAGVHGEMALLIQQLAEWTALLGVAYRATHRGARPAGWTSIGLVRPRWRDLLTGVGYGTLLLIVALIVAVLGRALPGAGHSSNIDLPAGAPAWAAVNAVEASVGAPLVESIFFQGLMFFALARWLATRRRWVPAAVTRHSAGAAVLVTVAVFAGLHAPAGHASVADRLTLVAVAAAVGYALTVLTARSGRLAPAIMVHAVVNTAATILVLTG